MNDQIRALEVLDRAQRETQFCPACGSPTVPVARDGALWLECVTVREDRPFLRKLLSLDFGGGHTRRIILADVA